MSLGSIILGNYKTKKGHTIDVMLDYRNDPALNFSKTIRQMDAHDNLVFVRAGYSKLTYHYTYDERGNLIDYRCSDGSYTKSVYNEENLLIYKENERGDKTTYQHDNNKRKTYILTHTSSGLTDEVVYTYDEDGSYKTVHTDVNGDVDITRYDQYDNEIYYQSSFGRFYEYTYEYRKGEEDNPLTVKYVVGKLSSGKDFPCEILEHYEYEHNEQGYITYTLDAVRKQEIWYGYDSNGVQTVLDEGTYETIPRRHL